MTARWRDSEGADLAGDDIPLLGGGHQHLGLLHLLLRQLHVSRQLLDHQPCGYGSGLTEARYYTRQILLFILPPHQGQF